MRAISQIVAALALMIVAAGAAAIYFSVVSPLISRPSGGIAISLASDLELELSGSIYTITVYLRVANPLTYSVTINKADALIIFNGPNTASVALFQCYASRDTIVRPGSINYIKFSCASISSTNYDKYICVAYTGSESCTLTSKMVSDVMKMASIASMVIYYIIQYPGGGGPVPCILLEPGGRCLM
ncbi:MAG: hypothetical protein QXQ96_10170 [Sulfolobales archaeon]